MFDVREYLGISAYLYICFSTLLLYKSAILREHGIDYVPHGMAAGKALLLAKFIVVGHKLRFEVHLGSGTLIHVIIYKSLMFFLLLFGLSAIEQVIIGVAHRRSIVGSLLEISSGKLGEIVASCFLLVLILISYFAFRELDSELGKGKLLQLLRAQATPRCFARSDGPVSAGIDHKT